MAYIPGKGWDFPVNSGVNYLSDKVIVTASLFGCSLAAAAAYFYFTSSSIKIGSRKLCIPGLHNLGHTCYANSLLQGLASLPSVLKWLDEIETKQIGLKEGFLDELKSILKQLNTPSDVTLSAAGLSAALSKHKWNISFGVEHDLYELFNVFVSTWEDELNLLKKRLIDVSLLDLNELTSPDHQVLTPNSRRKMMFKRCADVVRSDAKIRAPTFGLTATELRCNDPTCRFKKVRYDAIGGISVSIPRDSTGTSTTLEYLLKKYFLAEIIRGATCDRCKETSGKVDSGLYKKQGFSKLPQCLLIRIERVGVLPSGHTIKVSDHVGFGETLDVRHLIFNKNNQNEYSRMASYRSSCCEPRTPESTSRIVGGREFNDVSRGRIDPGLMTQYGTIDGGSFMSERREAAKYRYQLRAVSEHRGVPETGHFVTYRRGITDMHSWYLTSDSKVTRVPYSQVAQAEAYLLYYERIQPNRWYKDNNFKTVMDQDQ